MINHIRGTITAIDGVIITVDVGGFGLGLSVAQAHLYSLSQSVHFVTFLHWNQESGPQIFGFSSSLERQIFILIIGCSGIGPKIALAVLGQLSPHEFIAAVSLDDVKTLSSLKGIGLKKAEALILHLQDKLKKFTDMSSTVSGEHIALTHIKNITEVLTSLDYSRQEITFTMDHLKKNTAFASSSFDDLLRKSLTFLAKTKSTF